MMKRGNLVCTEPEVIEGHTHTEDCYGEKEVLICGEEEQQEILEPHPAYGSVLYARVCLHEVGAYAQPDLLFGPIRRSGKRRRVGGDNPRADRRNGRRERCAGGKEPDRLHAERAQL